MNILAIDLGGMSAKVSLFVGHEIKKEWIIKTDLKDIFGNIAKNLESLNKEDVDIIGLAVPGFIDDKNGIIKLSGNLKLKDFNVNKEMKKYFKAPVFILNDANAAALGEYWRGAGKKYDSLVLYTIGTGIGGGIIINGELVTGNNGYAGELGHGGNFQDKWECTCGLKHCIEPVSSATGITRALKEAGFNLEVKDAAIEWIENGNKEIENIFKEALTPLANHIAMMQTAINPDGIVIGGGPSNIGEPLRKMIEEIVSENQLDFISSSTEIVIAQTKNAAGVYGAAYWAMYNNDKNKLGN